MLLVKKYGRKEIICKDIARSIRFFVMGFCDIVGISSVFSKGSLWMAYNL